MRVRGGSEPLLAAGSTWFLVIGPSSVSVVVSACPYPYWDPKLWLVRVFSGLYSCWSYILLSEVGLYS